MSPQGTSKDESNETEIATASAAVLVSPYASSATVAVETELIKEARNSLQACEQGTCTHLDDAALVYKDVIDYLKTSVRESYDFINNLPWLAQDTEITTLGTAAPTDTVAYGQSTTYYASLSHSLQSYIKKRRTQSPPKPKGNGALTTISDPSKTRDRLIQLRNGLASFACGYKLLDPDISMRDNLNSDASPRMSLKYKSPFATVSEDGLEVQNLSRWSTVLSTHAADTGKWYYEVEILPQVTTGLGLRFNRNGETMDAVPSISMRIGWSSRMQNYNLPLGATVYSCGIELESGQFCWKGSHTSYAVPFHVGDTVGCYISLKACSKQQFQAPLEHSPLEHYAYVSQGLLKHPKADVGEQLSYNSASHAQFTINGQPFGRCMRYTVPYLFLMEYHPAISLFNGARARVNFGPSFKFYPFPCTHPYSAACYMPRPKHPLKLDVYAVWFDDAVEMFEDRDQHYLLRNKTCGDSALEVASQKKIVHSTGTSARVSRDEMEERFCTLYNLYTKQFSKDSEELMVFMNAFGFDDAYTLQKFKDLQHV